MSRHDYLYRECRECSCADGECAQSNIDRAIGMACKVVAVVGIVLLVAIRVWEMLP